MTPTVSGASLFDRWFDIPWTTAPRSRRSRRRAPAIDPMQDFLDIEPDQHAMRGPNPLGWKACALQTIACCSRDAKDFTESPPLQKTNDFEFWKINSRHGPAPNHQRPGRFCFDRFLRSSYPPITEDASSWTTTTWERPAAQTHHDLPK
jgi:hypothetical protein